MTFNIFCIIVFAHFLCVNCFITYIEPRVPLQGNRAKPGSPWPMPQIWNSSSNVLIIDTSEFEIIAAFGDECDVLQAAMQRYQKIILMRSPKTKHESVNLKGKRRESLSQVTVVVSEYFSCSYPQQDDDESYKIEVSGEKQAWIESKTVWGALHALETLSQLIYEDSKTKKLYVNETKIHDWPSYNYRGVMIDTARHYIPVKVLLNNLEAMAINKMNVFHWHMVDDQSFPFQSTTYPNLSKYGAFSERHVYSQKDITDIVEFARLRGIRVLPEIDTPGHTKAIGKSYPQLLTACYGNGSAYSSSYPQFSEAEVLNPTDENVYKFLIALFEEMQKIFPEKYIHLGMDEVNYGCWQSNPAVRQFMNEHGFTSTNELEQYYVRNLIERVKNIGYKYVMWQDPIDNGVQPARETIVQIWKDSHLDPTFSSWQKHAKDVANKGYKMVVSACWYLNYISYPYPGNDWEKFLHCDPRDFDGSEDEKSLVLGGEACLWTEFVDATNLLSRLWPRASAVAERLWTNPTQIDEDSTRFRLDQQRCNLVKRGIPAAPILNGFCGDFDWKLSER
ncbi:beta-hexosaminidase subunit alpha-like protein [Leptotrombidium deliense]|uniref:Beta-hexosaminidase n=1 Tax=Leptotrombidium deliense TaxID=299467 RepID=A0A443SQK9_9ACAR|nr:beta-hexosaminidase subunit alpha-like protein [Leptotrombidium deliense]